ncbi:HMG-box protein STE11 [Fusarium oxysporum f. sp. albedinis]|nr:HMG-box protein STE11 [Fusarium oxysporum f. sp. albedinis]
MNDPKFESPKQECRDVDVGVAGREGLHIFHTSPAPQGQHRSLHSSMLHHTLFFFLPAWLSSKAQLPYRTHVEILILPIIQPEIALTSETHCSK